MSSDFKFEHAPQCVSIAASIAEALSGRNYTSIIDAAKSDDPLALFPALAACVVYVVFAAQQYF